MAPLGAKCTRERYDNFLNSLHPEVKRLILKLERINDKMGRSLKGVLFANSPGHLGSIPGLVISKTLKMVVDTSMLYTQYYKVRIKRKVGQYRERRSDVLYILVLDLSKRKPSGNPRLLSSIYLI